jgi:hypothetical protein
MLGLLGNLFAGWKRVPKHFDQQGEVTGWFKRGMGGYRLSRAARAQDGGRHAQGAATLLADPDLADRYRRE